MTHPPSPPDLIETMLLRHGRIARWPGHRARLLASARHLGYPLDAAWLEDRVGAAIGEIPAVGDGGTPSDGTGAAPAWRVRLLLSADGRLSLESSPLPPTSAPVRIALARNTAPAADNPWLRHKTTHRPWFAGAQRWLEAHPDHFDLIFGNAADELCEGSRCNVYVQDAQGRWLTPPASCGLLPGVERQWLLDHGLAQEARLSVNDARQAPALRVSNALRGWLDARLD